MSKKKRYCHVGYTPEGNLVYSDPAGKDTRALTGRPVQGKSIPPGRGLSLVEFEPDGEHAVMEDVVTPSGPAQVATPAYRAGWDHTFN